MSENIELGLELKTIRLERDKTKLEVDRVSNFVDIRKVTTEADLLKSKRQKFLSGT